MGLGSRVRRFAERLTGLYIYRSLPRGVDMAHDLAKSLPKYKAEVIFDIGANVGHFTKYYLDKFPSARIYSIEPVSSTFRELEKNLRGHPRVECHQVAFGATARTGTMVLRGPSDRFFLADEASGRAAANGAPTEAVSIITLDEFCHAKSIKHISYLKIDTEGGDLNVLKGAHALLAGQHIELIEVEAGMNPFNTVHAPFEALKAFLEAHQYFLFGLYEQMYEWLTREPHLRRTNPVFISRRLIDRHRGMAE